MKIKVLLYIASHNGKGYSMTCSSAPDKYADYEALFKKIAGTVVLK